MKTSNWILNALFLLLAWPVSANENVLLPEGVLLGRVAIAEQNSDLKLTIDLAGDIPEETHVMARFQNNRPQQRIENGTWVFWNERTATLIDNGFDANGDGTLTFDLIAVDLSDAFLPVTLTVAYRTEDGLKSGYLVIDR